VQAHGVLANPANKRYRDASTPVILGGRNRRDGTQNQIESSTAREGEMAEPEYITAVIRERYSQHMNHWRWKSCKEQTLIGHVAASELLKLR